MFPGEMGRLQPPTSYAVARTIGSTGCGGGWNAAHENGSKTVLADVPHLHGEGSSAENASGRRRRWKGQVKGRIQDCSIEVGRCFRLSPLLALNWPNWPPRVTSAVGFGKRTLGPPPSARPPPGRFAGRRVRASEVEHRQVSDQLLDLELGPNGPDVPCQEWRLRSDQRSLVPGRPFSAGSTSHFPWLSSSVCRTPMMRRAGRPPYLRARFTPHPNDRDPAERNRSRKGSDQGPCATNG